MARRWLSDLGGLTRLSRDIRGFLRTLITVEQAVGLVRRRLETREGRFVRIVEQAINAHPWSPYRQLLRAAGCEFGDLKVLVAKKGLRRTWRTVASHRFWPYNARGEQSP